MVFHEHWFDEAGHGVSVADEAYRLLQPVFIVHLWDDDCHVNVAPSIGRAFGVGTIKHDLQLAAESRGNQLLVSPDELEGFFEREYSWSIHCLNCLVCSTMSWQVCSLRLIAMRCLCSG